MLYSTPEKEGISSANIQAFLQVLEDAQLPMHDVIICRHGKIVFEKYWAPFHKDYLHRMYSVTKSFVSLAIGFLEQDGLVDLDAPISRYFPEETRKTVDPNKRNQTVRHMLMMSTARVNVNWFEGRADDRVQFYFERDLPQSRPSGTIFNYDSSGSFVMGALVERITGKDLMTYLREKLLDKIGFSQEAYMLKCPGGHSWSDSALICKPTDLLKAAQFCMNKGRWNGEQLLNEAYVTAATSKQIDNNLGGRNLCDTQGYGYQFWMTYDNSFFFYGMGSQLAVCIPDKDMIFVCNGDTQGYPQGPEVILGNFFRMVVRTASDAALEEAPEAQAALQHYAEPLQLFAAKGAVFAPLQEKINGVTFRMEENPMGITSLRLCFRENGGTLYYTNATGDKTLSFGMCANAFGSFPEPGYSDMVGSQPGDRLYRCAVSAAWVTEYQLFMKVQIIDTYFGNLNITFGFRDADRVGVYMEKTAEDFLNEYQGFADGRAE